jgi:chemotaxis methyl-accepting protein methylase
MQTQIEIAYNLKYIDQTQFNKIYEDSREIERMISAFLEKIKQAYSWFFREPSNFETLRL